MMYKASAFSHAVSKLKHLNKIVQFESDYSGLIAKVTI